MKILDIKRLRNKTEIKKNRKIKKYKYKAKIKLIMR